jgi:hypothetical protein
MLATSVTLALFASTFAASSLNEGVGDAVTKEAASRKRVVESFMVRKFTISLSVWKRY